MKKQLKTLLLGTAIILGSVTGCNNNKGLYLPSKLVEYNSYYDKVEQEITYEYDKDLLGYTKTTILDIGIKSKQVEKVRFSNDYSTCEYNETNYKFIENEYVLEERGKKLYTFLENGSYIKTSYAYDFLADELYPNMERGYFYNERGQEVRNYSKRLVNLFEPVEYISDEILYEYNELGYKLKVTAKTDDGSDSHNLYTEYYDEYSYNDDFTTGRIDYYILNDSEFINDGWTTISIEHEDNLIKFDEQNYFKDGTLGNHNVHHYNENWFEVYTNYGDGRETYDFTLNEFNQITYYKSTDTLFSNSSSELNVVYEENGGNILSSTCNDVNGDANTFYDAKYSYKNNQLASAEITSIFRYPGKLDETYSASTKITYSKLQNDDLLKTLDCFDDIISSYSHYVLVE